jgi:hypothetical protein
MVRRRKPQRSLFEVLLPDSDKLWPDWLKRIDTLLEDEAVLDTVASALEQRWPQSRTRGRAGTPAEVVLRMLILKHLHDWSVDELEQEVRANLVYRAFTRIGVDAVPDAKTILKIATALGPEVITDLHRRVVEVARRAGVTHGRRFRIDTTVVETNVHYPTDSTLLQDGVRVLTRAMQRASADLGDTPASIDPAWEDPAGVPISAFIFGGRRETAIPLVYQAFNWNHGVYLGATVGSETTAAAAGEVGKVRRDPMAMLPFCGYNMGDYLRHWLKMGKRFSETPRVFHVNWFRRDATGAFIWPGYRENMRILRWIVERVEGLARSKESPIGWVPRYEDIDWSGLDFPRARWDEVMNVDRTTWRLQTLQHQELFLQLAEHLPKELIFERENLISRC